ncbi:MAG TPA: ATP synthase F0 subunit B [Ruminococcaceae bacterium]|nr:ATP synthase F0 subunit B [Oscillospiraceae bacterium]
MDFSIPELAVDILLNLLNIGILFVIVKLLVYKPVKKFLSDRNQKIKNEIEEARKLQDSANETLSKKNELIEEGRAKGEAAASEMYKKAQEKSDAIIKKAKSDAEKIIAKANAEADTRKQEIIKSSRNEIADLSIEIAEKILEREVSKEDNRRIADEFFNEV